MKTPVQMDSIDLADRLGLMNERIRIAGMAVRGMVTGDRREKNAISGVLDQVEDDMQDLIDDVHPRAEKPAPNSLTPSRVIDLFHRIEGLRKDLKGDPEAIRACSESMRKAGVSEAFIETLESVLLDAGGEA